MILTKEQLAKRFKDIGGEFAVYFYDRKPEKGEKLTDVIKTHMFPKSSLTEQISRLESFAEESPYQFWVMITKSSAGASHSGVQMAVDLGAVEVEQMEGTQTIFKNPAELEADLRRKILEDLERERRERELEERERELEEEKEELKTTGGKLWFFLNQFLGAIQNTQQANKQTMNGTTETNETDYSKAIEYITEQMGKDGIIKLAEKVKANPSILGMVKNFIGS